MHERIGPRSQESPLTPAQQEMLEYIALGMRDWEISDKLSISKDACEDRRTKAYKNLGVKHAVQAVVKGLALDLLTLEDIIPKEYSRKKVASLGYEQTGMLE